MRHDIRPNICWLAIANRLVGVLRQNATERIQIGSKQVTSVFTIAVKLSSGVPVSFIS